ncbi:hypothetical protein HKD37_20G057073 [Glycine soja]
MTIAQFIKHLEIVEKTVQVWYLDRREPQVYWFKVEFLLQWQHMKGWKLPLIGNRKCKSILRFIASNFRTKKMFPGLEGFPNHTENATDVQDGMDRLSKLLDSISSVHNEAVPISINYRLLDDQREGVRF